MTIGYYLPLEKGVAFLLNKLESPPPKDALCQIWLKLAQCFWRRRFLNIFIIILLFRHYLPLEKEVVLYLNKSEFPPPKDALCQVWLNLAQWFWSRRLKCEKFTYRRLRCAKKCTYMYLWLGSLSLLLALSFHRNVFPPKSVYNLMLISDFFVMGYFLKNYSSWCILLLFQLDLKPFGRL